MPALCLEHTLLISGHSSGGQAHNAYWPCLLVWAKKRQSGVISACGWTTIECAFWAPMRGIPSNHVEANAVQGPMAITTTSASTAFPSTVTPAHKRPLSCCIGAVHLCSYVKACEESCWKDVQSLECFNIVDGGHGVMNISGGHLFATLHRYDYEHHRTDCACLMSLERRCTDLIQLYRHSTLQFWKAWLGKATWCKSLVQLYCKPSAAKLSSASACYVCLPRLVRLLLEEHLRYYSVVMSLISHQ